MKNIQSITIVIFAGIIIWFIFFDQKPMLPDNNLKNDIAYLKLEAVWDSIEKDEYLQERSLFMDSIKLYKDTIKIKDNRIISLNQKYKERKDRVDTFSTDDLGREFDCYVGIKSGKTVKEIDSSQLMKSVQKFDELDYSRDIIDELIDKNNYLTIVSIRQDEAIVDCDKKVISLHDSLSYRNKRDKEYVVVSKDERDKERKICERKLFWGRVKTGVIVIGCVVVLLKPF